MLLSRGAEPSCILTPHRDGRWMQTSSSAFPGRKPSLQLEGSHERALPKSPTKPQHASRCRTVSASRGWNIEKFQCKHMIELKLPAPAFRWPQGICSKAPFCQPLVLLFFQSLFSDSTIALFTQEPWMLFLPWEISVLPGYQHKYKYCYSSSVVDFFQQTTAMTTNLEQLLTETSCLLNSLLMLQKALVFSVGLFTCIWKRQQGVTEVWKLYQYHAGPENGWLFKQ